MSNEEIVERIQKGIDVAASQERLLKQNRKFVRRQVRRLCGHMENEADFEDYEQEGSIGLLTAAMRYDKGRGTCFLTCAGYYIKAAIIRYSENCCSSVRVPVYLKERIRKYAKYRQQCMDEKGRYPTRDELLEGLDISARSLDHLEKTLYNMKAVSIDKDYSDGDGESSLTGMLQSGEDIEELITYSVYSRDLKKALDSALRILDADTRKAVQSIYYQGNSVKYTARVLGCSAQAVYEKTRKGFWKILHSTHRAELEGFMWDGYRYNEFAYSEFAEIENEESEFLI